MTLHDYSSLTKMENMLFWELFSGKHDFLYAQISEELHFAHYFTFSKRGA